MSAFAERVESERGASFTITRGEAAIHEAGHVLALEEAGIEWKRVFLPDDVAEFGGRVEADGAAGALPGVLLAGRMADSILAGGADEEYADWLLNLSYFDPADWDTEEATGDEKHVLVLIASLPAEVRETFLRSSVEWVQKLLSERWDDVLRLAEALDAAGHLTAGEARAVLAGP